MTVDKYNDGNWVITTTTTTTTTTVLPITTKLKHHNNNNYDETRSTKIFYSNINKENLLMTSHCVTPVTL